MKYYFLQMLSADEYFNVVKLQNGVDCSKEEVKTVCMPLPCSKDGKIKIRDFLYLDIHRYIIPFLYLNQSTKALQYSLLTCIQNLHF